VCSQSERAVLTLNEALSPGLTIQKDLGLLVLMTVRSRWCSVATPQTSAARVPHTMRVCTGIAAWQAPARHRRATSAGIVCSHTSMVWTAVPVSARRASTLTAADVGLL
jgi:hypothetical protein